MEKLSTSTTSRQAMAHGRARVEKFLELGWRISVELEAEDGETYEWLLNWPYDTDPVRPVLTYRSAHTANGTENGAVKAP